MVYWFCNVAVAKAPPNKRNHFFLGKFIPADFLLNQNYASLEANCADVSSQNGRKCRVLFHPTYVRFHQLSISILSAVFLKEKKRKLTDQFSWLILPQKWTDLS